MDSPLDLTSTDAARDLPSPTVQQARNGPISLLSLPDELLGAIIGYLPHLLVRLTLVCRCVRLTLVCRCASRIAKELLYWRISLPRLRSESSALLWTLMHDPNLRHYARIVSLSWPPTPDMSSEPGDIATACDYEACARKFVDYLRFPNVRDVSLHDVPPLVLAAGLAELGREQALLHLRSLMIKSSKRTPGASISAPEFWSAFTNSPTLVHLTLHNPSDFAFPSPDDKAPPCTDLQQLPHHEWLVCLKITQVTNAASVEALLATGPVGLRRIDLAYPYSEVKIPLERYLPRYPHLMELTLCSGYSSFAILPLLQSSAIQSSAETPLLPTNSSSILSLAQIAWRD